MKVCSLGKLIYIHIRVCGLVGLEIGRATWLSVKGGWWVVDGSSFFQRLTKVNRYAQPCENKILVNDEGPQCRVLME